jgi:hypothetical protein
MWNFFGVISEVGYYRDLFRGINPVVDVIQIFSHNIPAVEDDGENIGGVSERSHSLSPP